MRRERLSRHMRRLRNSIASRGWYCTIPYISYLFSIAAEIGRGATEGHWCPRPHARGPDMPDATILVVDDTAEILDLTSSVLEEAGYGVLRCGGSREAMAILSDGHNIDLLLTDIMMPGGIDGFELARQARAVRPSLSVAYITGYAQTPPEDARCVFGPILRKPHRQQDFARQIDDLLAPIEEARTVQAVAREMITRHTDALDRAKEAEEIDRAKGDELSARAWHDIAEAVVALQHTAEATRK